MDILLVTAYYPLKKSKYSTNAYNDWTTLFFQSVTCPVIFFCSSDTFLEIHSRANSNVKFVQRDFGSWDMMKEPQMSKWREWHNNDHEKNIHSPELYAIWAAKQEFVREAIKIQESKCYIWCDAGLFRTRRNASFKNTLNFIQPKKITCLDVKSLCNGLNLIGGGTLAGDKDAWIEFSNNYLQELQRNINGKDQVIYQRILNDSNATIINPNNKYGDPWFYLSSLFSENINFLTVDLIGGLGNQLFQLAFLLYASKITGRPNFLMNLSSPRTQHSSQQYFETLLQKWKYLHCNKDVNIELKDNHRMEYVDWNTQINSTQGNIRLNGYFQRYQYVDLVRDDFISRLNFNDAILGKYPDISNKFFIHVRGGDYVNNPFHDINPKKYYATCIELCKNEQFVIFTNDVSYANSILPNIPIIQENEVDTLYLMSKAKGCICINSSFSWWGAYLNPNRPIFMPSKWYNDPHMDTRGYYFHGCKIINTN